jgi:hypothetical protein
MYRSHKLILEFINCLKQGKEGEPIFNRYQSIFNIIKEYNKVTPNKQITNLRKIINKDI